jgi:hypothetical protein
MYTMHNRRRFLATLSSAVAAGLIGPSNWVAQEAPPETTTIWLARNRSIYIAPQYTRWGPAAGRRLYRHPLCNDRCGHEADSRHIVQEFQIGGTKAGPARSESMGFPKGYE